MRIEGFSAWRRIAGFLDWTPIRYSMYLSRKFGRDVYLKLENFQVTGSFKVRGIFNKFLKLFDKGEGEDCFLTVSTGNHGLAFSYAAKILGLNGRVIVPKNITDFKLERIKSLGGQVLVLGESYDEAEELARKIALKENCNFVSPYNDLDIIEGQSTIGVEILYDLPEVDNVIVPVGGGGLISGISYVLKNTSDKYRIIGVQSEASRPMVESFKRKELVKVEIKESLADGLSGNVEEGSITFDFVKRYVDDMVAVSEESILEAMRMFYFKEGLIVEGSAAVTLAALMENKVEKLGDTVLLVVSGGNVDLSKVDLVI